MKETIVKINKTKSWSFEKRNKKSPKISRRKDIIKIRAEINEKEMKGTIVKVNKTKSWFFEKLKKLTDL